MESREKLFGRKITFSLHTSDGLLKDAITTNHRGQANSRNSTIIMINLIQKKRLLWDWHLDTLLLALHEAVDKLQGTSVYDRICLLQSLCGVGFLSAVVLMAEMGDFDLLS